MNGLPKRSCLRILLAALLLSTSYACSEAPDGSALPGAPTASAAAATAPASLPASRPATAGDQRRIHALISGKVQGVGFRAFTQEQAQKLKLTGFVSNLPDGRVEMVAEGPSADIEKLIAIVKQGPPMARVESFDCKEETPSGQFEKFDVRN